MIAGLLALVVAAAFTGAAVYILWAEQPARMKLDDRNLLTQWQPSYGRGFAMQSSLAILGLLLGGLAWWQTGHWAWMAGGVAMIANWPWTMIAMMTLNKRLMGWGPDEANAESRALIQRWAGLHSVRAGLGALGALLFLWAAAAPTA